MPQREYECPVCGHRQDFLELRSDEKPVECEACGCKELKLIPSTFSFRMRKWH